jgi:hypothetical protein
MLRRLKKKKAELQAEKRKNNVNKTIKFNNNSELRANLLNRIKELSTHTKKRSKNK